MRRTLAQKEANDFDAALYDLICKATAYQDVRDELAAFSGTTATGTNPWREGHEETRAHV